MPRSHPVAAEIAATNLARASEPGNERLDRFVDATQLPLDLVALLTAWFFLVPATRLQQVGMPGAVVWTVRVVSFVVFLGQFLVCVGLSQRPARYVRTHPVGLLAGVFPPVRFLLSLNLLRWVFRRGHAAWFLAIATTVLANLTVVVYLYEVDAPGANINKFGDAIWCAMATVSTVGYGDAVPVTFGGRVAAGCIMALGVTVLAVVTATVSSTFMDQARLARGDENGAGAGAAAGADDATSPADAAAERDELLARLARIEALLAARGEG